MRTLSAEGYSGCEVRVTHARTEIIIRATHTQEVLGEKGRRIRELTALVQKRFKFPEGSVELYAEKVQNRGLDAIAQCESLRYKLLGGLAVRRSVATSSPLRWGNYRIFLESIHPPSPPIRHERRADEWVRSTEHVTEYFDSLWSRERRVVRSSFRVSCEQLEPSR